MQTSAMDTSERAVFSCPRPQSRFNGQVGMFVVVQSGCCLRRVTPRMISEHKQMKPLCLDGHEPSLDGDPMQTEHVRSSSPMFVVASRSLTQHSLSMGGAERKTYGVYTVPLHYSRMRIRSASRFQRCV